MGLLEDGLGFWELRLGIPRLGRKMEFVEIIQGVYRGIGGT